MSNAENKYIGVMRNNKNIPNELIDFLTSDRPMLFYGTGNQGVICEEALVDALGFKVEAFLKSDEYKNVKDRYSRLKAYCLSESPFCKEEVGVIISIGREESEKVYKKLKDKGYPYVYQCDDWDTVNAALREVRFQALMEEHGIEIDKTNNSIRIRNFKFNNPWKEKDNYLSFFLGEFGELVAPHILHDLSALRTEGPYCYGDVDIIPGDVVLDLGANIGLFSATAAAIGCKVYSFEPIDFVAEYLRKTTSLYNGAIEVIQAAASDNDGEIEFSKVDDEFHDIGESTILDRGAEQFFETISVKSRTIDDFVRERKLEKVDFIKADIEGAERLMLKGARETLKTFAPKLSLCTYHLPDDKEVMTKLILEANPNYIIKYNWEKLYAYVPLD